MPEEHYSLKTTFRFSLNPQYHNKQFKMIILSVDFTAMNFMYFPLSLSSLIDCCKFAASC